MQYLHISILTNTFTVYVWPTSYSVYVFYHYWVITNFECNFLYSCTHLTQIVTPEECLQQIEARDTKGHARYFPCTLHLFYSPILTTSNTLVVTSLILSYDLAYFIPFRSMSSCDLFHPIRSITIHHDTIRMAVLRELSTVITGLASGVVYEFRLSAVNEMGRGEWSRPSKPALTMDVVPRTAHTKVRWVHSGTNIRLRVSLKVST